VITGMKRYTATKIYNHMRAQILDLCFLKKKTKQKTSPHKFLVYFFLWSFLSFKGYNTSSSFNFSFLHICYHHIQEIMFLKVVTFKLNFTSRHSLSSVTMTCISQYFCLMFLAKVSHIEQLTRVRNQSRSTYDRSKWKSG